jgi:hypothetical protein
MRSLLTRTLPSPGNVLIDETTPDLGLFCTPMLHGVAEVHVTGVPITADVDRRDKPPHSTDPSYGDDLGARPQGGFARRP